MNILHQFLTAGFRASVPFIGEKFNYGADVDLDGFFTQVTDSMTMEITGFKDGADWSIVAERTQFTTPPELRGSITRGLDEFKIVEIKTDPSSFVLMVKKVSK